MLDLILEEFDLEKNEVFGLKGYPNKHRVNKNGLEVYTNKWGYSPSLDSLLFERYEIVKLPFVPEPNETYYAPDISIADLYRQICNYDTKHDKHRIKYEICFRTKQEAIVKAKEWLKLIGGE